MGAIGWGRIPSSENGNTRNGVDSEEFEEFSAVHGVFNSGHAEFEENSQVPMPSR